VVNGVFNFFSEPVGTPGNALLNWEGPPAKNILAYAGAYRAAACRLVNERQMDMKWLSVDEAALPIVYLYRHAFELYLKAIVYRAAILTINEEELRFALPRLWREHSLVRLLAMAEPVLFSEEGRYYFSEEELLGATRKLATTIDHVDSGSYSFRYPVTAYGSSALPENVFLNIYTFSDAVESVVDGLSIFCGEIERVRLRSSEQMKLALHPIRGK
jgi:hypothetical protein